MSLYTEGKFKTREAYRLARGFDLLYRGEKTEDMPLIYADWRGQEISGIAMIYRFCGFCFSCANSINHKGHEETQRKTEPSTGELQRHSGPFDPVRFSFVFLRDLCG